MVNYLVQIAGPRTRCNAGGAFINGSGIPVLTPAIFCAPTPASAQVPAPIPAFASAPGLPKGYTDEEWYRTTKLALELFIKGQNNSQL